MHPQDARCDNVTSHSIWNPNCTSISRTASSSAARRIHANTLRSRRKALKVVDLRNILSKAEVSAPQKANKQDLITKILASEQALKAYRGIHEKNDGGEEEDELVSVLVWSLNVDG